MLTYKMVRDLLWLFIERMTKIRMPTSFGGLWLRVSRKAHILFLLHTYMALLLAPTENTFEHRQVTLEIA